MASSSAEQIININTNNSYVRKERTIHIPWDRLDVQVESPVDLDSLERNGVDLKGYIGAQEMLDYFRMLNGPSYMNLVKNFWIHAEVFDRKAAEEERVALVEKNPELKGKTRTELGLKEYKGREIRSTVMGMEITITEETISRACKCSNTGRFQWEAVRGHWEDKIISILFQGRSKAKTSEMSAKHRLLLKILTDCLLQKGGGTDQLSLDHKVVLYFLATFEKINLPKYILYHMCWAIKESQRTGRRQIPYGRLLSEIFVQGRLLQYLKNYGVSSDHELGTVTGKIINGRTLQSMKIIEKFHPDKRDLKESAVQSDLMKDFPPISKEDNPEVIYQFIAAHFKETGERISIASIPDTIGGAPLRVKGKRTKITEEADAPANKPKRIKTVKSEVSSSPANTSDPAPGGSKKRKSKGNRDLKESFEVALSEIEEEEATGKKKAKRTLDPLDNVKIVTPEEAQMAKELAERIIAERRPVRLEKKASLKAAELLTLTSEVEQEAVKEATTLLKVALKGKGSAEAAASEAAPEAAGSEANPSGKSSDPNSSVFIQTISSSPSHQSSPSSLSSSSTDSDDIPLSQRFKKPPHQSTTSKPSSPLEPFIPSVDERIISLSEQKIELCKRLPADHPFQPPMIQPLISIPADETVESSSIPPPSDIPQPSSPSPLSSLEKHLGGEMSATPKKTSKTVPKKTVIETQQTPNPTQEKEPEVPTELQNLQIVTIPQQLHEPEPQQTEPQSTEPESQITRPEPSILPILSKESDQPSFSNVPSFPRPLTEADFVETELLRIKDEVQKMFRLRESPLLSLIYEDQWTNLKKDASDLLDQISQKCISVQALVVKKFLEEVPIIEEPSAGPILYLANAPFFSEDEYTTRDKKIVQKLKKKLLTIQTEVEAKDEAFEKMKKRTETLEEVVARQAEEIKKLSEITQTLMKVVNPNQP